MGKFNPGDLVRNLQTGEQNFVKEVPGMPSYDRRRYIEAHRGMTLANGKWVVQDDWEPISQGTYSGSAGGTGGYAFISPYNSITSSALASIISSMGSIPSSSPITTTMKKAKFKIGDKVRCLANNHSTDLSGAGYAVILADYGTCTTHQCKQWTIIAYNKYGEEKQRGQFGCEHFMEKYKDPKAVATVIVIDEKALAPLVLNEGLKKEIISVLKQHENSNTIFETWGLGETIKYGKGMSMLFHGGPGTGKTWAAHCIGKAMGRELLIINAANIQTSEPGGANRNIEEAFKSAVKDNKILFLDECDSLITARNDVGMVLSSEINTLLTEIEKFEGVLILATNRADTLDEALERRLALIINFSNPDFVSRCEIWAHMLPKKMPIDKDVTIEALAEAALTGGQIKNALLQAARLAAAEKMTKIPLSTFQVAIKRIVQTKGVMGKRSRYHQHQEVDVIKGPVTPHTWQK